MYDSKYLLRFLPVFYEDLEQAVSYILNDLNNISAAADLVDSVEASILKRLPIAESFEQYHSKKQRTNPYYRIYVKNYIVFYVVLDEGDAKVMEVRRLLYNKRDRDKWL